MAGVAVVVRTAVAEGEVVLGGVGDAVRSALVAEGMTVDLKVGVTLSRVAVGDPDVGCGAAARL
jgi:hypothetical protein